jgi:hypothetical protein
MIFISAKLRKTFSVGNEKTRRMNCGFSEDADVEMEN